MIAPVMAGIGLPVCCEGSATWETTRTKAREFRLNERLVLVTGGASVEWWERGRAYPTINARSVPVDPFDSDQGRLRHPACDKENMLARAQLDRDVGGLWRRGCRGAEFEPCPEWQVVYATE